MRAQEIVEGQDVYIIAKINGSLTLLQMLVQEVGDTWVYVVWKERPDVGFEVDIGSVFEDAHTAADIYVRVIDGNNASCVVKKVRV